jgi:hypothetical protein
MATPLTIGSIWRLTGVAEFSRTKSMPEREAMFSKVIGSAWGVSAAPEIQITVVVRMTILAADDTAMPTNRMINQPSPST